MKAAELRKSILQAAVQGKLVPQDIHDEPASVLLERICAEKARLVKEGKIKKEKPLPPITEDEVPYDLPEGWVWCRLGDILQFINGDRGKNYPSKEKLSTSGLPFISALNIKNGCISTEKLLYVSREQYDLLGSGKLRKNDIVFCIRGSLGKCGIFQFDEGAIASSLVILRQIVSNGDFLEYLYRYLNSPLVNDEMRKYDNGTAQPNLSASNLMLFLLPLPPLAEQQRIVDKVNELMVLCDELEAAEQELDALEIRFEEYLPKSILQAAVQGKLVPQDLHDEPASVLLERIRAEKERLVKEGKIKKEKPLPPIMEDEIPYDLPEGWVWCRLGDLGDWGAGATPLRSESRYYHNGTINWLKTGELNDGIIYKSEEKITEEALNECSLRINKVGDVLIAMYGATIGKLAIVGAEMTTNQACCGCTPFTGVYNYYLFYLLKAYRKILVEKGEGGAQPNISRIKIRNLPVPLPPFAEQQRIVAKVVELMALCEEIKAVKTKPIEQRDTNKVIDFPAVKQDGQLQLAARGEISKKSSNELMQAIDEMFAEDE